MLIVKGIPASAGIVLGPAIFSKTARIIVQPEKVIDAKKELDRFVESQKEGIRELDELYQEAVDVVGEEMAQIFDIHKILCHTPRSWAAGRTVRTAASRARSSASP